MAASGKRRTPDQILRDRARIATLYLDGWTQEAIAGELGCTQQQVSYDIKRIREDWQASALVKFDEAKAIELAKIDQAEREYWAAWRRSVGEHVVHTEKQKHSEKDGPSTEKQQRREELSGDPRFLQGVERCIEQRLKILGFAEVEERLSALEASAGLKR